MAKVVGHWVAWQCSKCELIEPNSKGDKTHCRRCEKEFKKPEDVLIEGNVVECRV